MRRRVAFFLSLFLIFGVFTGCPKPKPGPGQTPPPSSGPGPTPPPEPVVQNVTIQGFVGIDPKGTRMRAPVNGALVATSLDSQVARTDDNGNFLLRTNTVGQGNYAKKPYTIKITAEGFEPWSQTHSWGDNPTQQTFYLTVYDPYKHIATLAAPIVEREFKNYLTFSPMPSDMSGGQTAREQELQKAFNQENAGLRTSQSGDNQKFGEEKEKDLELLEKAVKKAKENEEPKIRREFAGKWEQKRIVKQKKHETEKFYLAGRQILERKQMKTMFVQERERAGNPDEDQSDQQKAAWEDYIRKHALPEYLIALGQGQDIGLPEGKVAIRLEPQAVERGRSAKLIWEAWNTGNEVTIEPGIGKVVGQKQKRKQMPLGRPEFPTEKEKTYMLPPIGYGSTINVTPEKTTTYKISAKDWNGKEVESSAEVKVTEPSYAPSKLRWIGIGEDRVGKGNSAVSPDGDPDGVFELTLEGEVDDLVLMTADAEDRPCCGQQWDTLAAGKTAPPGTVISDSGGTWVLGILKDGVNTPINAGTGVSQFDGTYTGSWNLTCPTCGGGDTAAGTLKFTVTNGMFTGPNEEIITSGNHSIPGTYNDGGTVSLSGAMMATITHISPCSGNVSTLTGQITMDSSGGAVMTGKYSRTASGPCATESGTWTATRTMTSTQALGRKSPLTLSPKDDGSRLINRDDGSVEPRRKETHRTTTKLYAANSGYFKKGQNFVLFLVRPTGIERVYTKIETEPVLLVPQPVDEVRHEPAQDRNISIYAVCDKGRVSYMTNTSWNPKSFEVNQEDRVRLTVFGPPAGTGDFCYSVSFALKDYNIFLPKFTRGTKQEATFTANKFGKFAYVDSERRPPPEPGQYQTQDIREETRPGYLVVHKNIPPGPRITLLTQEKYNHTTGSPSMGRFATDGNYIYFLAAGPSEKEGGIFRIPIGGGPATRIYPAPFPESILVLRDTIYWIDANSGPHTDTQVLKAPKNGKGPVTAIYTGSKVGEPIVDGSGIATDGDQLYTADEVQGRVHRMNFDGSSLKQVGENRYGGYFDTEHVNFIAEKSGRLYVLEGAGGGSVPPSQRIPRVVTIPVTGAGGFTTRFEGKPLVEPSDITIEKDTIYIADSGANTVWGLPIDPHAGRAPTSVVSGKPFEKIFGVRAVDNVLYVSDRGTASSTGRIYRVDLAQTSDLPAPIPVPIPTPIPVPTPTPAPIGKVTGGACVVRDSYSGSPSFGDPDVGRGYSKKIIPGVNDIEGLRSACTDSIYQELIRVYAAAGNKNSIQKQVLTFQENGGYQSTGCDDSGCEFVDVIK